MFKKRQIEFHCKLPEVLESYPIIEAKTVKFNWLKQSAKEYKNMVDTKGKCEQVAGTIKCPGLHNIMHKGFILTSWFDLTIRTDVQDESCFEYIIPENIDSYLKLHNFNMTLINWFSGNEPALRVPLPKQSLQSLIKISTPWTVYIPKNISLLMMPVPYPDEPEFSAVHGILEPGNFYDINAIIQVHKKPGELFIPAGTPLCQMIVIDNKEHKIIQKQQTENNWKEELKNRFKIANKFTSRNY